MSDSDIRPQPTVHGGRESVPAGPVRELLTGTDVLLGGTTEVRRLLPTIGRRMIGAWCFANHYPKAHTV